jgi:hypothetical protein
MLSREAMPAKVQLRLQKQGSAVGYKLPTVL